MTFMIVFNLVVSSAGFAAGSVFLKRYADAGAWFDLGAAFVIFGFSNLVTVQIMTTKGLGQTAMLGSMAHLMLMSAMGVALFGERLGQHQLLGLVFALIAIWLLAQGSQNPT